MSGNRSGARLWCDRYTADKDGWRNIFVGVVSWIGAVGYVITVSLLILMPDDWKYAEFVSRLLLVLWAVVPPASFWFEFHIVFKHAQHDARGDFEEFKHSQELSRNIWIAFVGVILALYFNK